MTVYVVQKQLKLDKSTGDLVPRFPTIEIAREYGELEYLLSSSASPFNPAPIISELQEKLYNFCDLDHLLLIGNPVLIGLVVAIAADANQGAVKMLQWSGTESRYKLIEAVDLFPDFAGGVQA